MTQRDRLSHVRGSAGARWRVAAACTLAGEASGPLAWAWRGLAAWPALAAYRAGIAWRDWGFRVGWFASQGLEVPVLSVGNLSAGGTGKTPAVVWVVRELQRRRLAPRGLEVGVLSRGYRPLPGEPGAANDEALLLAEALPDVSHVARRDRVAAGRDLLRNRPRLGCLVLDDGFSHRRLKRDVDLVLIDVTRPLGDTELLPRGLQREPMRALRRATAVVMTRVDQAQPARVDAVSRLIARHAPSGTPVARAVHAPVGVRPVWTLHGSPADPAQPVSELAGRRVALVAGIGNPAAFARTLQDAGAKVVAETVMPDHHVYTEADVRAAEARAAAADAEWLLTTQKDAMRLRRLAPPDDAHRWRRLDVELRIVDGEEALWDAVCHRLDPRLPTEGAAPPAAGQG